MWMPPTDPSGSRDPDEESDLHVDVEFLSSEDAAKNMTKGTPAGWRHPSPGSGVEIYRRANVLVFWHQGTVNGPAPTSAQQQAVDDCLS